MLTLGATSSVHTYDPCVCEVLGTPAPCDVLTFGSHFSTQQGGQQVPQQTPQMATQQQMPCQQAQQVQGGPVTAGPYVS